MLLLLQARGAHEQQARDRAEASLAESTYWQEEMVVQQEHWGNMLHTLVQQKLAAQAVADHHEDALQLMHEQHTAAREQHQEALREYATAGQLQVAQRLRSKVHAEQAEVALRRERHAALLQQLQEHKEELEVREAAQHGLVAKLVSEKVRAHEELDLVRDAKKRHANVHAAAVEEHKAALRAATQEHEAALRRHWEVEKRLDELRVHFATELRSETGELMDELALQQEELTRQTDTEAWIQGDMHELQEQFQEAEASLAQQDSTNLQLRINIEALEEMLGHESGEDYVNETMQLLVNISALEDQLRLESGVAGRRSHELEEQATKLQQQDEVVERAVAASTARLEGALAELCALEDTEARAEQQLRLQRQELREQTQQMSRQKEVCAACVMTPAPGDAACRWGSTRMCPSE